MFRPRSALIDSDSAGEDRPFPGHGLDDHGRLSEVQLAASAGCSGVVGENPLRKRRNQGAPTGGRFSNTARPLLAEWFPRRLESRKKKAKRIHSYPVLSRAMVPTSTRTSHSGSYRPGDYWQLPHGLTVTLVGF
jgi:hypothetical protein